MRYRYHVKIDTIKMPPNRHLNRKAMTALRSGHFIWVYIYIYTYKYTRNVSTSILIITDTIVNHFMMLKANHIVNRNRIYRHRLNLFN